MQRSCAVLQTILAALCSSGLLACTGADDAEREARTAALQADALVAQQSAERRASSEAFFGDLHIHSRWSFDAYSMGVPVGPDRAYEYARGEAIPHVSGENIRMTGPPLDFMALTEHATYMGVSASVDDPDHPLRKIPLIRDLTSDDPTVSQAAIVRFLGSLGSGIGIPELLTDDVIQPTWNAIVELADRNNRPGEFTAFVAYEYTTMPDGQNLHRNVIFRGSDVPARPFSSMDSPNPEDLWSWMEEVRQVGDDVIAIPHNANGSNGLMYQSVTTAGDPIDAVYSEVRLRNEPISEVMQIKGQSETHPVLSTEDEWADFEIFDRILGRPADASQPQGSYARRALMDGLELADAGVGNPYQFGMIGASDGHNASSPTEESNYTGKIGFVDGTPEARLNPPLASLEETTGGVNIATAWGAAGLAGVWAESNTREALFDAMRAKETFATSGPRIQVRLFGGWSFSHADLGHDMVVTGYRDGVPMGGELSSTANSATSAAPTFLVRAARDPREATLERVQMVKAGVVDGKAVEKIFDIACADGAAPDPLTHRCGYAAPPPSLASCGYDPTNGAAQISAFWRDPEFDASQRAFYYVRVLQIPTCRWSTFDALQLGRELPDDVPATIQERAITSPIWYTPTQR